MQSRLLTIVLASAFVLGGFSAAAFRQAGAQEEKKAKEEKKATKNDKAAKEEKKGTEEKKDPGAAAEASGIAPGPEHEVLKSFVGTWDATINMPAPPGSPPMTSKGVETCLLGCGGLWLITDYKGDFMGTPFHGHGIQGYDSEKKKYVGVWVDPMSASLDVSEGTYDAASKTLTSKAKSKDPASGQELNFTMKYAIQDKDSRTMTLSMPGPDGKEMEAFRINYKRKK